LGEPLSLSSPAFVPGGDIPRPFTCDGENIAPHLVWTGAPTGVNSFELIMDDPDAPRGTVTPLGGRPEQPSRDRIHGPCPPSGVHHYVFRLFVLDVETLGLTLGASPQQVEDAMGPHVIANG
jgi:phosphatidylethanolamine-binding protein (PEBP) family uncharacterized protein